MRWQHWIGIVVGFWATLIAVGLSMVLTNRIKRLEAVVHEQNQHLLDARADLLKVQYEQLKRPGGLTAKETEVKYGLPPAVESERSNAP